MPSTTVQSGDSLWTIAKKKGVDWLSLVAANPQLSNPNLIQPGQQIRLPSGRASESARSRAAVAVGVSATGRPGDVGQFAPAAGGGLVDLRVTPQIAEARPAPELKAMPTSPYTGRRLGVGGDVDARTFTSPAQQVIQPSQLISPYTGRQVGVGAPQTRQPSQLISPRTGRRPGETVPIPGRLTYEQAVPVASKALAAGAGGIISAGASLASGAAAVLPAEQEAATKAAIAALASVGRTAVQSYYGQFIPRVFQSWQRSASTPKVTEAVPLSGAGGRTGAPMTPQGPIGSGFSIGGKMFHFQGYDQQGNPLYAAGGSPGTNEAQATLSYLDRLSASPDPASNAAATEFAQRRSRFGQSGGLGVQVWMTEQSINEGRYPTYATERVFEVIAQRMGWQGTVQELMIYLGYQPAPPDYGPGVWYISGEAAAGGLAGGIGGGGFFSGGYSGRSGGIGGGGGGSGSGGMRNGPGFSNGMVDWRITA